MNVVQADHISLGVFPRVQNKISFCFNPCKMIQLTAEKITGLSNTLLEHQPSFTESTLEIIKQFLNLQRKPVCLVAHNGYGFDYPIFKAEIHKVGGALSDDIYCIDTLVMFRNLHKKKIEADMILEQEKAKLAKPIPAELCDGFDELLVASVEKYEKSIQEMNETTPRKNNNQRIVTDPNLKLEDLYFNPNTSNPTTSKNGATIHNEVKCKKKLINEKISFKLVDIYERLTNKSSQNAHRAEDDCNMLIECAATLGQEFVDYANENAKKFCDIPMMTIGKQLGT
ncbi:uncharacterized protein [Onthophagus taurus]|nr:uncharacterized protein LOC111413303 isoform X2 [Onthophagus taurus]